MSLKLFNKMYKAKKHQMYWVGFFAPILLYIYFLTAVPSNLFFLFTNFLILLLGFIGMSQFPDRTFSLSKLVYVFIFFFFGVIPLVNESSGTIFWGGENLSEETKVLTNFIILLGIGSFAIGERIRIRLLNEYITKLVVFGQIKRIRLIPVLIIFLLVLMIILKFKHFNFYELFFRGIAEEFSNKPQVNVSQIEQLVINNTFRPMPIFFLYFFYYFYKLKKLGVNTIVGVSKINKYFIFLMFLIAIIFISPVSMARYMVAALYLPFIMVFTDFWDKRYRMQLSMIALLIFFMPILDVFRRFNPNDIKFEWGLEYLDKEHFDAYQNFCRLVDIDFISYGNQLLGALLFFVPRSLWEDKPVGTGSEMAKLLHYDFTNVSMPFMAEGYANFGVIGVAFFMSILGIAIGHFDKAAWVLRKKTKHNLFLYYYYSTFGMLFFMLRGDLMSSFAYSVGISLSFLLVLMFFKFSGLKIKH